MGSVAFVHQPNTMHTTHTLTININLKPKINDKVDSVVQLEKSKH